MGRLSRIVYCWLRPRCGFRSRRWMTAIVRPLGSSGGNSRGAMQPLAGVARPSHVSRVWRGVLGVSVVVVAAVDCGTSRAIDSSGSAHAPARTMHARATITIAPGIGETFAPVSGSPKLTAWQAWVRFARLNGSRPTVMPSAVHVQLGLFTLPVGPADAPGTSHLVKVNGEAYTAHNELAYGYSSPSRCPTTGLPRPPGRQAAPQGRRLPRDARCLFWTFLDANSGKQIVSTWQKIGHWHWLYDPKAP